MLLGGKLRKGSESEGGGKGEWVTRDGFLLPIQQRDEVGEEAHAHQAHVHLRAAQ